MDMVLEALLCFKGLLNTKYGMRAVMEVTHGNHSFSPRMDIHSGVGV